MSASGSMLSFFTSMWNVTGTVPNSEFNAVGLIAQEKILYNRNELLK
jgi:hypothetical protein